jgi:hypothetical protein
LDRYSTFIDLSGNLQRLSTRLIEIIFTFEKCGGGNSACMGFEQHEATTSSYQLNKKVIANHKDCSCALACPAGEAFGFGLNFRRLSSIPTSHEAFFIESIC